MNYIEKVKIMQIEKSAVNNTKYKRSTYIINQLQKLLQEQVYNKSKQSFPHFKFYMNTDFMEDEIYYGETLLIEKSRVVHINSKDIYLFEDNQGERFIARCKQTQKGLAIIENKPVNEKFYKRFSTHLGLIPMVFICPSDIYELVYNQENRRKLIDQILSQQSSNYLNALQNYQKLLQQRNHLLKQQSLFGKDFSNMLNAINTNIIPLNEEIYKYRTNLIDDINITINNIFYSISNIDVSVSIKYESNIELKNIENLFNDTLENDLRLTHTTIGIHRDKLYFLFNNDDISQIASQGQQKLFIIALKLSLYQWLSIHYNEHAILLLDDIFDKLDKYRTHKLLEQLQNFNLTQIFITDTDADRIASDQVNNLIVL